MRPLEKISKNSYLLGKLSFFIFDENILRVGEPTKWPDVSGQRKRISEFPHSSKKG